MLTLDLFLARLKAMGVEKDPDSASALLESVAKPWLERGPDSSPLDSDGLLFRLSKAPVLDTRAEFYRASSEEGLVAPANLLTLEIFDFNDEAFTQTQEVALDPGRGIYRLLTATSATQFLVARPWVVMVDAAINTVLYEGAVANPISSFKKGTIEVKSRSLLEEAARFQELQARSGEGVEVTEVTRYSNGRTKGRRNAI